MLELKIDYIQKPGFPKAKNCKFSPCFKLYLSGISVQLSDNRTFNILFLQSLILVANYIVLCLINHFLTKSIDLCTECTDTWHSINQRIM